MKLLRWLKSRTEMKSEPTTIFPLLDVRQEIARLREHYESSTRSNRFYKLAAECITEIYGPLEPKNFNSLSATRGFFASKQRVIRDLLEANETATVEQSS